jgi:POT family proton-dependent oligopeptide transporter
MDPVVSFVAVTLTITLSLGVFLVMSNIVPIEILVAPAILLCAYFLLNVYRNATESTVKIFIKLMYFPMLISVVFFALYLQLYSSVTIFILHDVNTVIMGWNIPITWLTSIEPVFIILMAPISNRMLSYLEGKRLIIKPLNKIFIGIITTAITFFLLSISAYINDTLQVTHS